MKYADDAMVACVFREVPKNGKIFWKNCEKCCYNIRLVL